MRISALIPSYNRAATLERALRSVIEQSSPVDEIILVDDGSTDASASRMAALFPDIVLLTQANRGVSAARNRGIAAARFEWVALLDSDDCWHADKIARIREAHRQDPDQVLYHSDEIWIRHGARVNPMRKHRKRGGWIFRHCLPLCAISPSTVVIRRATLRSLGGFDERLPACEDYDLWLRLCHRYPVHFVDEALITRHAGHRDQLSRRYPAMDRFRVQALDRLLHQADLTPEDRAAAIGTLLGKLDILINGAAKRGNRSLLDECVMLRERWRRDPAGALSC